MSAPALVRDAWLPTWRDTAAEGRVLIVSNRLPYTLAVDEGRAVLQRTGGGLVTGLRASHEAHDGLWFGWPGALDALGADDARHVRHRFAEERAIPVRVSDDEIESYYEHVSNALLWPVCHDRLDRLPLRMRGWDVYERVNERFAETIADAWRPGDRIWVHDYHLMRLPALLRERLPSARIGFFLHVPFPSAEIFAALPVHRWLLDGMLGADVIGFHTRRYAECFVETLAELHDVHALECGGEHRLELDRREIRVAAFPIGVDASSLSRRAASREVSAATLTIRHPAQRLVLGVDRLDYTKGIPRRLLAIEQFFRAHPEWRGRVRVVQIAVPSRDGTPAYRDFRDEVEALISRINGELATPDWTPIHYVHRAIDDEMLLALYRAADVMLVTPVRDGMNLVAKEFVACRPDEDGVLVLSRFAGAATELDDALLVNPYDVDDVAATLHRALGLSRGERRSRMARLRARVQANDVHRWSSMFLRALSGSSVRPMRP